MLKALRYQKNLAVAAELAAHSIELDTLEDLKIALDWKNNPNLDGEDFTVFENVTQVNRRRLRDAEVVAAACRNCAPGNILEIGTSFGQTTALMAQNAPDSTIHTVNIPPEEIAEGGKRVTHAISREAIGRIYRERGFKNVEQIFANTANWKPTMKPLGVAYIDGCHDADFVYNDTRNALAVAEAETLILWHDFAPHMLMNFEWLRDVAEGIIRLYREKFLRHPILHVKNSWVGLYRVGGYDRTCSL
jgi:hypothetical protein